MAGFAAKTWLRGKSKTLHLRGLQKKDTDRGKEPEILTRKFNHENIQRKTR